MTNFVLFHCAQRLPDAALELEDGTIEGGTIEGGTIESSPLSYSSRTMRRRCTGSSDSTASPSKNSTRHESLEKTKITKDRTSRVNRPKHCGTATLRAVHV